MTIDANDSVITSREKQQRWLEDTERWLRSHTDDGIEMLYIDWESGQFRVQTEAGELAGEGSTIPRALEEFLTHLQMWEEPVSPERNDDVSSGIEIRVDALDELEETMAQRFGPVWTRENDMLARITRLEGLVLLLAEKQGIDTDGPAARRAISGVRR